MSFLLWWDFVSFQASCFFDIATTFAILCKILAPTVEVRLFNCHPYQKLNMGVIGGGRNALWREENKLRPMKHSRYPCLVTFENWSCHFLHPLWIRWPFSLQLSMWLLVNNLYLYVNHLTHYFPNHVKTWMQETWDITAKLRPFLL